MSTAPTAGADDNPESSKPITLDFQRAELGAVLNAFAQFTGLNLVASERVRGCVSLRLDKVPWRTAFDTLLDVNGLAMERRGNMIWVAPLAALAAREKQRFEAHARAADLEPLASRTSELHIRAALRARRGGPKASDRIRQPARTVDARRGHGGPAHQSAIRHRP